jgi:hypothetical protein
MSELTPEHFDNLMETTAHKNLPPFVEVKTPNYRAVVDNFFSLPIGLLVALKEANLEQDGSDILILFDAAETAFTEEDFDRVQDLTISQFFDVIRQWVTASASQ